MPSSRNLIAPGIRHALAVLSLFVMATNVLAESPRSNLEAPIRAGIEAMSKDAVVTSINDSPIPGLMEVIADNQVLYFTLDGKYLIAGDIFEVPSARNVTEEGRSTIRANQLATSPQDSHIVFGKKDSPKKIYVFTDTSCVYCQRFHREVPEIIKAGIAVEYLAWPRGGPRSPELAKMQSIWCAKDRQAAYEAAVSGGAVTPANCESPVRAQWELGTTLNVEGTPSIYDQQGNHLGGYVSAKQIIEQLIK